MHITHLKIVKISYKCSLGVHMECMLPNNMGKWRVVLHMAFLWAEKCDKNRWQSWYYLLFKMGTAELACCLCAHRFYVHLNVTLSDCHKIQSYFKISFQYSGGSNIFLCMISGALCRLKVHIVAAIFKQRAILNLHN